MCRAIGDGADKLHCRRWAKCQRTRFGQETDT